MTADITTEQFEEAVIRASHVQPVLVDFWATWCQPCRMLAPILDQLVTEAAGKLKLVKVDTDREQDLATALGIRSLPTVLLFVDGRIATQFSGVQPLEAIRHLLEPFLPRASDSAGEEVSALVAAGRLADACTLLRGAIEADPDNYRLHGQLADLLLTEGKLEEAEDLLRALPPNVVGNHEFVRLMARLNFARTSAGAPDRAQLEQSLQREPDNLETRYTLSAHQVVAGEYEQALDNLLAIILADRGFRDDGGRRAMVDVFILLDNDDPLVRRYRGRLSSALN